MTEGGTASSLGGSGLLCRWHWEQCCAVNKARISKATSVLGPTRCDTAISGKQGLQRRQSTAWWLGSEKVVPSSSSWPLPEDTGHTRFAFFFFNFFFSRMNAWLSTILFASSGFFLLFLLVSRFRHKQTIDFPTHEKLNIVLTSYSNRIRPLFSLFWKCDCKTEKSPWKVFPQVIPTWKGVGTEGFRDQRKAPAFKARLVVVVSLKLQAGGVCLETSARK